MKRIVISLALLVSLILTSCGTKDTSSNLRAPSSGSACQLTEGIAREYNENMTSEQYQKITEQLVDYVMSLSDSFSEMSELCVKYADTLNSADTFTWSQYWDFREIKADIDEVCENILEYDDSECSSEYQLCVDEIKSMAFETLHFFAVISEEKDVSELTLLTNQFADMIESGMNQATIYQTQATIAYLEANNGDEATIEELKSSLSANDTTNTAYPSKSKQFTNKYGTSTTKCAHSGCTNYIASSGDTNCCIIHSSKCLNCGKYIDGDALFCMDCLKGSGTSSITHSGGCKYMYFDGSLCGKPVSNGMTLCKDHFNELNDIYNSLIGK